MTLSRIICASCILKSSTGITNKTFFLIYIYIYIWQEVRIWEDSWVPWLDNFKPIAKDSLVVQQPLVVSQLIDAVRGEWDLTKLQDLFDVSFNLCHCYNSSLKEEYAR